METRLFIFGAGYSGRAIGRELGPDAAFIGGTTRSADKAEHLAGQGIEPFVYSGDGFSPEILRALAATTHLIVSIAPDDAGDRVLADLRRAGADVLPVLKWVGYLSTVGIYGDHDCAWVDEESACRPVSARSRWRLAAEESWTAWAGETGTPLAILRLAGIYGPGRNAFVNLSQGTAKRIVKPGQVFNRIHVEDIAGAVRHLMRENAGGIFNVTDDEPSPPQDLVLHAARLMGVEPPPEIPFETAQMSPMARSFYSECKRVSNGKLKASGYRFRHPDSRQALAAMWAAGGWGSEPAANML